MENKEYQTSKPVSYDTSQSFQKFMSWTNEKQKTFEAITHVIKNKNESFLDIGAGNGLLTKLLEKHFEHIVAIEPSKSMFNELQINLNPEKSTLINEKFLNAKIEKKFDVILASHVFQYIGEPLKTMNRIKSLLKKDGLFLLVDHKKNSEYRRFYNKYRKDILLEKDQAGPVAINYNLGQLLSKIFAVETICFNSTLSIPSIDDAISIFDFLYDVDFENMQPGSLARTKQDMQKVYTQEAVTLNCEYNLFVCKP